MKPAEIAMQMALEPGIAYLNHAAFSPLPKRTYKILASHLDARAKQGSTASELDIKEYMEEKTPHGKQVIAKLIGGDATGVAFTRSTLQGLHTVVEGFPWKKGNNIVINDMEFTTNSFVHQVITKKNDLDLRVVPNHHGTLRVDDFERLIDEQTRLVAISLVQFSNGFCAPIKEIANLVHEVGGYLLVDGIQAVGAMPVDCKAMAIDALAAGAYKWGMGPFSTGFLWVTSELQSILAPSFVGWWSIEDPLEKMSHCEFVPASTGQHYEHSPSFESLGMIESYEFLLECSIDAIWNNIRSVTDHLVTRCEESGIQVYSSMVPDHRSGIVSIGWSNMNAIKIEHQLRKEQIAVSPRAGAIRVSPHAYNSKNDVDRFIDALTTIKEH
ncbi:MAG: aminotransferase class V-fold PLP-dependent enzyme [Candidatus Hodarchaeales archaeon]|jgi:selenocysteine lyase/cysteine desulfurase